MCGIGDLAEGVRWAGEQATDNASSQKLSRLLSLNMAHILYGYDGMGSYPSETPELTGLRRTV